MNFTALCLDPQRPLTPRFYGTIDYRGDALGLRVVNHVMLFSPRLSSSVLPNGLKNQPPILALFSYWSILIINWCLGSLPQVYLDTSRIM